MLLRQSHGGIKADHGRQTSDIENLLDHCLANLEVQVIQLRSVVPRIAGPIVAVIDIPRLAAPAIATAEDNCGISFVVVMIFDLDLDASIS